MKLLYIFIFIILFSCAHKEVSRSPDSLSNPILFAEKKMQTQGLSPEFIQLVENLYIENERDKVIELNVLGFLRAKKQNDNFDLVIPKSELKKVKKFLTKNKQEFDSVEKKYKVPKEVIASLLWVETKYGRDMGNFHIPSIYFSLLQADHPEIIEKTNQSAKEKVEEFNSDLEKKIRERSVNKALWAMDEMKALATMYKKGYKKFKSLKGSFAGAFGMAQFLPSSYLAWAKAHRKNPNLFLAKDSIQSVANYLNSNGWKPRHKETQEAALFHYNRDKSYVDKILKMSDCLKKYSRVMADLVTCGKSNPVIGAKLSIP